MTLYTPTKEEAEGLLVEPERFHDWSICKGALPPGHLLKRAIAADHGGWTMPRLFCDDTTRTVVGSAAFKSVPTDGKVEIGYGVAESCRHRGFATQGVRLLVREAFAWGLVSEVYAEASPINGASQRVLEKAGFVLCGAGVGDEGPVNRWVLRVPSELHFVPATFVRMERDTYCFPACLESFLADMGRRHPQREIIDQNPIEFKKGSRIEGALKPSELETVCAKWNLGVEKIEQIFFDSDFESIFLFMFWKGSQSNIHWVRFMGADAAAQRVFLMEPSGSSGHPAEITLSEYRDWTKLRFKISDQSVLGASEAT